MDTQIPESLRTAKSLCRKEAVDHKLYVPPIIKGSTEQTSAKRALESCQEYA